MIKLHTYTDYERWIRQLLYPLLNIMDRDTSALTLPNEVITNYTLQEARMETFSRMLLGVVLTDVDSSTKSIIFDKICKGTSPLSPFFWGNMGENSQMIVDSLPILLFCYRNKSDFNSLDSRDRKNIERWFFQINNISVGKNNWLFFPILINHFLKLLGCNYSEDIIKHHWENIDLLYLGNGWYTDGGIQQCDYYVAFAFHFYSLLYVFYNPDNEGRKRIVLDRAKLFAHTYVCFFANSGEFVPFGRSLTYKFAPLAFWAMYSHFIYDVDELKVVKGIINRNLRWWLRQHIFNDQGILVNGYAYANPYMLEQYNGSGSPYWAFKAFFFMLNRESMFFHVQEKKMPTCPDSMYIPQAGFSIFRTDGNPFIFINGSCNKYFCGCVAKYEKFVYSSLFGLNVPRSEENYATMAPDSTLVVHIGNSTFVRKETAPVLSHSKVQISDWSPIPGTIIRTFVFMGAPWHIRIHYILSEHYIELRDYGFATNNDNSYSAAISLTPTSESGIQQCVPNVNILHSKVKIPYVKIEFAPGKHLFSNAMYGATSPYTSVPTVGIIHIDNGKLKIGGQSYDLPNFSIKEKLSKIMNLLRV